jgi:hypothetical protein
MLNRKTIAAGDQHTCYLLSNGNSTCYGYNGYNQSNNYTVGDAIAVAAGNGFTCYLLSNGNSACRGNNNSGQTANYTGGNAIAVSAGGDFTCYLLSNGSSTCYGSNDYNQSTNYTGGDAIALSTGLHHVCYLLSKGNSTCYGSNDDNKATNYIGGDAIAVAAGNARTCYLLTSGNSTCYGYNYSGSIRPYTKGDIKIPFQVSDAPLGISNAQNQTQAAIISYNIFDGNYTYSVNCSDLAGNTNITEQRKITIDTTNPAIRFMRPTDNSTIFYTRTNIVENASASDANLVNMTLYLYNSTGLVNSTTSLSGRAYTNFTNLSDGNYYINATAYDIAGNSNITETRNINITYDRTAPNISFVPQTDANGSTKNVKYIQANVSAADNQSGVAGINAYIHSGSNLIASAFSNSSPLNATFSRLLNGNYSINATAYDVNGNLNKTETRNITIDRNLTVLILIPSPGATYGSTAISLAYIVGGHSTPTACWYYLDNGLSTAIAGCANTTISIPSEGAHCVYVYANGTNSASDNDSSCFTVSLPSEGQSAAVSINSLSTSSSVSCVRHSVGDVSFYVSSGGSPVSGAHVSVSGLSGSFSTDASGRALIKGLSDGSYTFSASASGYYATDSTVYVSCESMHTVDVSASSACGDTASSGATVSITVLYDSAPADGAQVSLSGSSDSGKPVTLSATSDSGGKARFSRIENGDYSAAASYLSEDGSTPIAVSCTYANKTEEPTQGTTTPPPGSVNVTENVTEKGTPNVTVVVNGTANVTTGSNASAGLSISSVIDTTAAATRDAMTGMMIFATSPAAAPIAIGSVAALAVVCYIVFVLKPGFLPFLWRK